MARWTTSVDAVLVNANKRRSADGARRQCALASDALGVLEQHTPKRVSKARHDRYITVMRLRLQYPERTLAEIAELAGVSKDIYAGLLRRGFEYVNKLKSTRP